MPVYSQDVLLEAQRCIAAGLLDTRLQPLVQLIMACGLKIMFGAGGKDEDIVMGLHLQKSL